MKNFTILGNKKSPKKKGSKNFIKNDKYLGNKLSLHVQGFNKNELRVFNYIFM